MGKMLLHLKHGGERKRDQYINLIRLNNETVQFQYYTNTNTHTHKMPDKNAFGSRARTSSRSNENVAKLQSDLVCFDMRFAARKIAQKLQFNLIEMAA